MEALENEMTSIHTQMATLSQREAAIRKTMTTYTGAEPPVIRATKEMNTVDMARTVIRNAGRPMKSKERRK
jgi:cob(I)alamin adenosyltransferase